MECLFIKIAFLSLIISLPGQVVSGQTDYHHMEFVMQWIPTFCWMSRNCLIPVKQEFSLHGLWPANTTGHTMQCAPPPTDTVVWEKDGNLEKDLHTYWPSLIRGRPDSVLWQHEWRSHGYCSNQTIGDADYFKGAVKFAKHKETKAFVIRNNLFKKGIFATNHQNYTLSNIKSAISKKNVYISCKAINATHVSLHEIYFCLDKMFWKVIPCPQNADTRGCRPAFKIIFPTYL